jgi:serine/threonine protein kinase
MQPGTRVGDYVLESELPTDATRRFVSTHRLLPRRAQIVFPPADRAFELARLLEALRHPAVPRIYECGRLDDDPWLALAMVDGQTLAERIAHGALPAHEVVAMLRDVGEVLAHAHQHGIVHGGLRPEGIASTPDGWRIVDWSEADLADDHTTDVEALGAIAYAALARSLPTIPLARRCPGVPAGVAELIDRMIGGAPSAARVNADAVRLFERLAQDLELPADDDDAVPISIEDIELVDLSRPPPLPSIIIEDSELVEYASPPPLPFRVRAQGSGPVMLAKLDLKKRRES